MGRPRFIREGLMLCGSFFFLSHSSVGFGEKKTVNMVSEGNWDGGTRAQTHVVAAQLHKSKKAKYGLGNKRIL